MDVQDQRERPVARGRTTGSFDLCPPSGAFQATFAADGPNTEAGRCLLATCDDGNIYVYSIERRQLVTRLVIGARVHALMYMTWRNTKLVMTGCSRRRLTVTYMFTLSEEDQNIAINFLGESCGPRSRSPSTHWQRTDYTAPSAGWHMSVLDDSCISLIATLMLLTGR